MKVSFRTTITSIGSGPQPQPKTCVGWSSLSRQQQPASALGPTSRSHLRNSDARGLQKVTNPKFVAARGGVEREREESEGAAFAVLRTRAEALRSRRTGQRCGRSLLSQRGKRRLLLARTGKLAHVLGISLRKCMHACPSAASWEHESKACAHAIWTRRTVCTRPKTSMGPCSMHAHACTCMRMHPTCTPRGACDAPRSRARRYHSRCTFARGNHARFGHCFWC